MTIQINPKLSVKTNLLNLMRNTNPAFSRVTEDMFVLLETGPTKVPNWCEEFSINLNFNILCECMIPMDEVIYVLC